jgi:hypothetical protein
MRARCRGATCCAQRPTKLQTRNALQSARNPRPIGKADAVLLFWAQHAAPLRSRQLVLTQAAVHLAHSPSGLCQAIAAGPETPLVAPSLLHDELGEQDLLHFPFRQESR